MCVKFPQIQISKLYYIGIYFSFIFKFFRNFIIVEFLRTYVVCEFVCARWNASIMFREEIGACVAIQTRYVMDACECVRSIILLFHMVGTSFMLVGQTRLNVIESDHWVTWSDITVINILFLMEKNTSVFLLNHIIFKSFLICGVYYNWKVGNFCLVLKHILKKLKYFCLEIFCLIKSVLWVEIWNLLQFDG